MQELVIWLNTKQVAPILMNKKSTHHWLKYSGLGIQMVVTMLVCLYIGKWVGIKFDFEILGTLIGVFFGLFASIYGLIKEIYN